MLFLETAPKKSKTRRLTIARVVKTRTEPDYFFGPPPTDDTSTSPAARAGVLPAERPGSISNGTEMGTKTCCVVLLRLHFPVSGINCASASEETFNYLSGSDGELGRLQGASLLSDGGIISRVLSQVGMGPTCQLTAGFDSGIISVRVCLCVCFYPWPLC